MTPSQSTIAISLVHVAVDDPDAALAFYRDTLGLAVVNDVSNEGFRWVTLATQGGPAIVLSQPHGGRSQEDGDALAALLAKGELAPLQFSTGDLAGMFERIAAAPGVEVLQEPTDQFWGVRDAAFRDPAGNLIRISQA